MANEDLEEDFDSPERLERIEKIKVRLQRKLDDPERAAYEYAEKKEKQNEQLRKEVKELKWIIDDLKHTNEAINYELETLGVRAFRIHQKIFEKIKDLIEYGDDS